MMNYKEFLLTQIIPIIALLIAGFVAWITWKQYSKKTKEQLQTIIKQELKKSFEKIDYKFINEEIFYSLYRSKNYDSFWQKYQEVFEKYKKWEKIKKWKPKNKEFDRCFVRIWQSNISYDQLNINWIKNNFDVKNKSKTLIFWKFYLKLNEFLWDFDGAQKYRDYLKEEVENFSKILFSKKICKRLKQLINHQYK